MLALASLEFNNLICFQYFFFLFNELDSPGFVGMVGKNIGIFQLA